MIFWYSGQPGHGKTLNGIDHAWRLLDEANAKHAKDPVKYPKRELLVCNVREFNHEAVGSQPLTPEEFKAWCDSPEYIEKRDAIKAQGLSKDKHAEAMEVLHSELIASQEINPRFHNAIVLIDEAYEHGIFPKRGASALVPRHVERMAKHRHYGMDFICISQSPDKQCDGFLHDLIDRMYHVRRRFGTKYVMLREFDKFCATPEKTQPLTITRKLLPKRPMGTYESTKLDTTDKKIPWYFYAMAIGLPLVIGGGWYMTTRVFGQLSGKTAGASMAAGADGAQAKGATAASEAQRVSSREDWYAFMTPRVASQPWTAPAYDRLQVPANAPRVFCMIGGSHTTGTCTCLTEQGTRYKVSIDICRAVAVNGQYEPFLDEQEGDRRRMDDVTQLRRGAEQERMRDGGTWAGGASSGAGATLPSGGAGDQIATYGAMGVGASPR